MRFTKLLMTMLPAVPPWVVPGENVENPGGVENVNPLDTLSSDIHEWGGRVRAPCPRSNLCCTAALGSTRVGATQDGALRVRGGARKRSR